MSKRIKSQSNKQVKEDPTAAPLDISTAHPLSPSLSPTEAELIKVLEFEGIPQLAAFYEAMGWNLFTELQVLLDIIRNTEKDEIRLKALKQFAARREEILQASGLKVQATRKQIGDGEQETTIQGDIVIAALGFGIPKEEVEEAFDQGAENGGSGTITEHSGENECNSGHGDNQRNSPRSTEENKGRGDRRNIGSDEESPDNSRRRSNGKSDEGRSGPETSKKAEDRSGEGREIGVSGIADDQGERTEPDGKTNGVEVESLLLGTQHSSSLEASV